MSQHDLTIANQSFPAFRSDLNNALQALGSTQAGSSAPSPTFAHQMWIDTSAAPNVLKIRNADNDAWITVGTLNQTTDAFNIAIAQGGTGATTDSGARTNLGLGSIATQAANNVSITGGSITGITDLAVADGGTGASSFTANNVLLGNGTSAFQVVAPSTNGNVLTSNGTTWTSAAIPAQGIGVGQTWTDVTSSRSIGTTYTNSTGKSIQLSISTVTNQFGTIRLSISGTIVSSISGGDFGNYQAWNHIIPDGVTYSVSTTGSGSSVSSWWELR